MLKEEILGNQNRRKNTKKSKGWVKIVIFSSTLKFFKLGLMAEIKIITMSTVVFNIQRGNV